MPFTPFHFGPGLFGKSLISRYFSWVAFITSQVFIDCETLYYMIQRAYPIHRFFHTFLGATMVGICTGLFLVGIRHFVVKFWFPANDLINGLRPSLKAEVSTTGLLIGALAGGVSHPLFDGIMHPDVRPFSPWSDANPFLRVIDLGLLHLGCLIVGLIGFILMSIRLYREALANQSLQRTAPR